MKKGFTLAETLITLGIIGVVAALTIPTLNLSTKERTFEAKRKVCVSDLENAFTTMMASEGATDMEETKAFSENKVVDNLSKYIKIYKKSDIECSMKNGAKITFANPDGGIKDRDNKEIEDAVRGVVIDVNDTDKKSIEGVHVFKYALLPTGLLEDAKF